MATDRQRREAARRKLERQQENRRQRQQRRKRANLAASVLGVLVVAAVVAAFLVVNNRSSDKASGSGSGSTSASVSPSTSASSTAAALAKYPCTWTKSGTASRKVTEPSTTSPPKTGTLDLAVRTNRGAMTFRINRAGAPCAVASTLSLVKQKFYDSTSCHRLVTSGIYVLQCGDPTATGAGGPGYTVNDEASGNEKYPAGTIAMARTQDANSTGSQFFIVYKDSPSLMQSLGAKQYDVIGTVSAGLDVVSKVAAGGAATGTDGKPKLPLTIQSITTG